MSTQDKLPLWLRIWRAMSFVAFFGLAAAVEFGDLSHAQWVVVWGAWIVICLVPVIPVQRWNRQHPK